MQNENTLVPEGTIQLDKLVFSCISTGFEEFGKRIKETDDCRNRFTFNKTTIERQADENNRYEYTYMVKYDGKPIGRIDFEPYSKIARRDIVKFTVYNTVFYNGTGKYLEPALGDLKLEIESFSKIEIAVDDYTFNHEKAFRLNLTKKGNRVKLLRKIVRDAKKLRPIVAYNTPTVDDYFAVRGVTIKNKAKTKVYSCYDKLDEISESKKYHILEYHKRHHPKLKHLYRAEIRLSGKAIKFLKKREITLDKLLFDPAFLWEIFDYEAKSVVSIKDCDLQEIPLYRKPNDYIAGCHISTGHLECACTLFGSGSRTALELMNSHLDKVEPEPINIQSVEVSVPMDNDPVVIYINPFINTDEYYLNNMDNNIQDNIMIDEYYLNNMAHNIQDNIPVNIDMVPTKNSVTASETAIVQQTIGDYQGVTNIQSEMVPVSSERVGGETTPCVNQSVELVQKDLPVMVPVKRKRVSFKKRRMLRNAEKKLRNRKRYAKRETVKRLKRLTDRGDIRGVSEMDTCVNEKVTLTTSYSEYPDLECPVNQSVELVQKDLQVMVPAAINIQQVDIGLPVIEPDDIPTDDDSVAINIIPMSGCGYWTCYLENMVAV
jgi:hypothetical protein